MNKALPIVCCSCIHITSCCTSISINNQPYKEEIAWYTGQFWIMLTFKQILRQSVSLVVKPMLFVLVTFFNFLVSKNRTSPPEDNWTKSVSQRSMVQWALDRSKFISWTVGVFSLVSHMSKFPFVKQQQTVWLSRVEILEILEVHVKGSSEKKCFYRGKM